MADSKITGLAAISDIDRANDQMVIVDVSDTTMAPTGTNKKMTPDQLTTPNAKTGVAVTFEFDSVHGTIASPETGNITASYTGAKLGVTVLIIHDNATEPTYPATWQKISGTYSTTVTNYISAILLDATHVKYSIYQDA